VRYATSVAFRTALETRLLSHAQRTGLQLIWLRRSVVFDRLLARLLVAAGGRWVLKGALALDFRLGALARTTKDLDLGRHDGEAATNADFQAAEAIDLGDYFTLAVERTSKLDVALEGAAVRYRV
jgi:predicted nucleotidyltransferase component of viral defense system